MTNTYKIRSNENIYTFLETIKASETIEAGLAKIAAEHNISAAASLELAHNILTSVNTFDDCYTEVEDDTAKAMRSFFKAIENRDLSERIVIMERVLFNLDAFADDELIAEIEKGVSVHTLYEKAKNESIAENTVEYELNLRYRLLERAEKMNLSPAATRRMAKRLKSYQSFTLNSAAVGKEHLQLKCAAAMYLYLDHPGAYSPEEAAVHACSHIYMENAAKAVRLGEITAAAAEAILTCVIVTAMLCLEIFLVYAGVNAILSAFTAFFLAIGALLATNNWSREISVRVAPVLQSGIDLVQEGFEKISSFTETRKNAKQEMEEELEYFEENFLDADLEIDEYLDEEVYCF